MTTVKYAVSAYTADGTTTDYLITWDYLDEDHIAVYVDGTSNADPTANHTFTKLNNTTLRITDGIGGAVVSGADIEIRRETPLLTRAITFADGSALLAEDLNKNSDYLLYSMQEVLDTVDAAAQDGALAAEVATEEFRDQAEVHKNNALAAQTAAETAQTVSETARDTTQTYLATVQSDATDADNHRIAAAASEAASLASETAAAASETAASASEAASATSAAASLASEQAASASETAAAASETAAAASEAAAATSELNAATSFDGFDDRYLGAKSTVPTVDNDGDALLVGALYWNDVSDTMFVWNGTTWDTLNSTTGLADSSTSAQVTITDTDTQIANTLKTVDSDFQILDSTSTLIGGLTKSTHSSGGVLVYGDSEPTSPSDVGQLGIYRATSNPFYSFHHFEHPDGDGARAGYIQSRNPWSDETDKGLLLKPEGTGKSDYVVIGGKGIRTLGNWQYLGQSTSNIDVANYSINWSAFGFDPADFSEIKIRFINAGTTSSAHINFRFKFNDTRFDGANYRWVGNRAYASSTTGYSTTEVGHNQTYGRISTAHDSTSHYSHIDMHIPNPGKNYYNESAGTAYQGYWSFSFGIDGISRTRNCMFSGYVNSTTSRNVCTGVWIDASAGNLRTQQFEIYGLPRVIST